MKPQQTYKHTNCRKRKKVECILKKKGCVLLIVCILMLLCVAFLCIRMISSPLRECHCAGSFAVTLLLLRTTRMRSSYPRRVSGVAAYPTKTKSLELDACLPTNIVKC